MFQKQNIETREFSFLVALGVGRQGKGTVETLNIVLRDGSVSVFKQIFGETH